MISDFLLFLQVLGRRTAIAQPQTFGPDVVLVIPTLTSCPYSSRTCPMGISNFSDFSDFSDFSLLFLCIFS